MTVAALGYLRIETTDKAAWMQFGTQALGLMESPHQDSTGAGFLRMDDHPFRFMIEPGEQDRLAAVGLQCRDASAWQMRCDALASAGHAPTMGSAEEAQRRCVSAFATVQDPSGNTVELYYGRKLDYLPFNSPAGVGRFITGYEYSGDLGLGRRHAADAAAGPRAAEGPAGAEREDLHPRPGPEGKGVPREAPALRRARRLPQRTRFACRAGAPCPLERGLLQTEPRWRLRGVDPQGTRGRVRPGSGEACGACLGHHRLIGSAMWVVRYYLNS